ncbi:MAG: hypothetical protein ACODAU_05955 [Myxococcota bacterium]
MAIDRQIVLGPMQNDVARMMPSAGRSPATTCQRSTVALFRLGTPAFIMKRCHWSLSWR